METFKARKVFSAKDCGWFLVFWVLFAFPCYGILCGRAKPTTQLDFVAASAMLSLMPSAVAVGSILLFRRTTRKQEDFEMLWRKWEHEETLRKGLQFDLAACKQELQYITARWHDLKREMGR